MQSSNVIKVDEAIKIESLKVELFGTGKASRKSLYVTARENLAF